jgi:hypothetical protein
LPSSRSLLLWLWLALLPFAADARPATPSCALVAEARVAGASIYLADLLPPGATPGLREAAGKIFLAAAPQPGASVALAGERIAQLLPEAAREQMIIPSEILVHRSGRPLGREEILEAIRAALRHNHLPGGDDLRPEDLHFSPSVLVDAADAQLRVRRIDFDAGLRQDRYLLVSASESRALPFLVLAEHRSAASGGAAKASAPGSKDLGTSLREAPASSPAIRLAAASAALVEPGKRAQLHVVSEGLQMFLEVLPLEKGGLHERVRVKIAGTTRVLFGEVVAPGRLEAQF